MCADDQVLDENMAEGTSYFWIDCDDANGYTGNRLKIIKQCSVMSCSGDGLKSFIAGIAILVAADGLTDSCTPDD